MPLYDFECGSCQYRFNKLVQMGTSTAPCPVCGAMAKQIMSALARIIVNSSDNLPLGRGAMGKMVKGEDGRRDIYVPSFGALEQDEIDYIIEGATEKEDQRLRKGEPSEQKQAIGAVANEMRKAPPGERAKTGEAIVQGGR